ncbi:hypothetical protein [Streptomyces sp. NPDC058426]|uniref:hypothetical protein n=1 Tax=Streptomyces sp. NPDC058426 TaxID=3346493 RepID=UPI0036611E2F
MTTRTEPTEHPDPEELADLAEDLLPPQHGTALRGHLADCPDCAEVYSSLAEIRTLLGALPAPPPLPADVSARIDAALREVAEEADVSRGTRAEEDAGIAHDVSRETSRTASPLGAHVSRETSTAPTPSLPSPPPDVSRETSRRTRPTPSRPAPSGPGRTGPRGSSRRRLFWGGTATVLALGAGSLLLSSLGTGEEERSPSAQQSQQSLAFSGSPLKKEVTALLQESGSTSPNSPKSAGTAPASSPQPHHGTGVETPLRADAPAVPPCVTRGIGRGESALGVEKGTYAGREAYLVVLPHARDTAQVTAYVVDAACATRRTGAKGEVLHSSSYPR